MVLWRDQNREVISADEDGVLTFWYSQEGAALFAIKAHNGPVTQMRWNEEFQQLITAGKDKTIKVWQLPERVVTPSSSSKPTTVVQI